GSTADGLWNLYKTCLFHVSPFKREFRLERKFKKAVGLPAERFEERALKKIRKEAVKKRKELEDQVGDCFIVYGHTHRSFVDQKHKIANTGSWVDDASASHHKEDTCIPKEKDTYITIKESGAVELHTYPE
ncbi:MAG: hypothetical protein HXS40_07470, partial [Theionarchaea archaeon]|nr:hypothetical protein [Theionarchaea archaeon]